MRALLLLALCACQCPPALRASRGHYEAVGALRDAAYRGDAEALAAAAAAMDGGGAASRGEAAAEGRLHGALGFLLVAEDPEERGEGLAAVARACGDCHRASGVRVPRRAQGEGGCPQVSAVEAAWWALVAGEGGDRDQAVFAGGVAGCGGCHRE